MKILSTKVINSNREKMSQDIETIINPVLDSYFAKAFKDLSDALFKESNALIPLSTIHEIDICGKFPIEKLQILVNIKRLTYLLDMRQKKGIHCFGSSVTAMQKKLFRGEFVFDRTVFHHHDLKSKDGDGFDCEIARALESLETLHWMFCHLDIDDKRFQDTLKFIEEIYGYHNEMIYFKRELQNGRIDSALISLLKILIDLDEKNPDRERPDNYHLAGYLNRMIKYAINGAKHKANGLTRLRDCNRRRPTFPTG